MHSFNFRDAATMLNLRPVDCDGTVHYQSVGSKTEVPAMRGRRPLLRLRDGDRTAWLLGADNVLEGWFEDAAAPTAIINGTPGHITGALAQGRGRALVMCRRGSLDVSVSNGQWSVRHNGGAYPCVSFRATTQAGRTCTVGDRSLGAAYTGGTTLGATARRALADDLAQAYLSACADGASEGLFTAPVVLWCRYLDGDGRELLTTPPVVVKPEGTFTPWVETTVADGKTAAGYVLTVPCCGIEAVFEGADCPEVGAVEVYATPCLHPYRKWQQGTVVATRSGGFRISLPGYGNDVSQSTARSAATMRRILGRCRHMGRLLATIPRPFDGHTRTKTIHHPGGESADGAGDAVDAALVMKIQAPTLIEALMESPHTFGADIMAADAGAVMWGGLHPVRSRGFSPLFFAAATSAPAADGARALVTVGFSGTGRRGVVLTQELPEIVPSRLGPVLSYPSPDATSIRITVFDGSKTRSAAFALTPDGSGRRSVYVSPGLAPIELPEVTATLVVDVTEPDDSHAQHVAACSTEAPLVPKVMKELVAPLEAVVPLSGSDSAWEFGRSRFVATSSAGLTSLTLSEGQRSLSVRLIAASPAALCPGRNTVYAALSNEVVAISAGNRKCATLFKGSFTGLAWDDVHGELLAMNAAGCTVWSELTAGTYSRTDCTGGSGIAAGGESFVETDERIYAVGLEDTATTVAVRLEARYRSTGALFAPRRLCLHCTGRLEEGILRLEDRGTEVCRATLAGDLRLPVVLPVLCRRIPELTLIVEGESDNIAFHSAKLLS